MTVLHVSPKLNIVIFIVQHYISYPSRLQSVIVLSPQGATGCFLPLPSLPATRHAPLPGVTVYTGDDPSPSVSCRWTTLPIAASIQSGHYQLGIAATGSCDNSPRAVEAHQVLCTFCKSPRAVAALRSSGVPPDQRDLHGRSSRAHTTLSAGAAGALSSLRCIYL